MARNGILAGLAAGMLVASLFLGEAAAAPVRVGWPDGGLGREIVIVSSERRLYLVLGDGTALSYPVAVGKAGKAWFGRNHIDGKYLRPAWSPPADVKRDRPSLPDVIPGGAPNNPMGAAALTLAGGDYAIHGTSRSMRRSIGTAASYGCIRMYDEDVLDLYARVRVGTPVTMVR